jgi:hypothetical protein
MLQLGARVSTHIAISLESARWLQTQCCGMNLSLDSSSVSDTVLHRAILLENDNGELKVDVDPGRTNHHNYPVHSESWIWKALED